MSGDLLILPSNIEAASFPNNTSSDYTTSLLHPIPVGKYNSLCLYEIHIPLTFYNVEDYFYINMEYDGCCKTIYMKEGVYDSVEAFKKMLNGVLEFRIIKCKLTQDMKFTLSGSDRVTELILHPKLARLMGMAKTRGAPPLTAKWHYEPWINHRIIYVHSNIIRPSFINEKKERILQSLILPEKIEFGENFSQTYFVLDYLKLEGEMHNCISIRLTDSFLDPILFRTGSVLVKLLLK